MKKVAIFLSLIFLVLLLQSCGEVQLIDIRKAALANSNFLVTIRVNVAHGSDPTIYIYAKEASYEQGTRMLTIKEGYLGTFDSPQFSPIFIQEATFYSKFPTHVTIKNLH